MELDHRIMLLEDRLPGIGSGVPDCIKCLSSSWDCPRTACSIGWGSVAFLSTEDGGRKMQFFAKEGIWRMASCCWTQHSDRFGCQPGEYCMAKICSVNGAWFPVGAVITEGEPEGLELAADEIRIRHRPH